MDNNIPEKFQEFLGPYSVVETDAKAQEPVGWGFPIVSQPDVKMGEEMWNELGTYGTFIFNPKTSSWSLVIKKLTDEEATEKYGPISNIEYGPRGGYKSITFGSTTFTSKLFKR